MARQTRELGFGALLADDMGLGKTLTVIAFHLFRTAGPTLVVCPASLLVNWEREFALLRVRCSGAPLSRGRPLARTASGRGMVVTRYGTLLRDVPDARGSAVGWWSPTRRRAGEEPAPRRPGGARVPGLRVAVTGTPVENCPAERRGIPDWTHPGRSAATRGRETHAREGPLTRLGAPFLMRRAQDRPDFAPELPEKVVGDRVVELSPEQAGLYRAVTAGPRQASRQHGIARRGLLRRLLQALRQICNCARALPAGGLRERLGRRRPGGPVRQTRRRWEELLDGVAGRAEGALVFTGYVSMGHLLARRT